MNSHAAVAMILLVLLLVFAIGCAAPAVPAATKAPSSTPAATPPSTGGQPGQATSNNGIPTAGQLADAGASVYSDNCARCHGSDMAGGKSPALSGPNARLDKYSTAQKLLDYMSTQMPLGKGGTLSSQAYLQVLAYCLVKNGFIQSSAPLDASKLDTIKLSK